MSLDCYPLGQRRKINLIEQPLALDVVYNDNLLISVSDQCQVINVHDLTSANHENPFRKFSLGKGIVLSQVVYCRTGDYLACVGDKNGFTCLYVIIGWRQPIGEPDVIELGSEIGSSSSSSNDNNNYNNNKNNNKSNNISKEKPNQLNSIDCCQRTGNLAVSNGELVRIYKYKDNSSSNNINNNDDDDDDDTNWRDDVLNDEDSNHSRAETIKENPGPGYFSHQGDTNHPRQQFEHIISVRLSICATKICLLENYLSITAADHVQVLKLELLTLQIQSDGLDCELLFTANSQGGDLSPFETRNYTRRTPSETTSTITTATSRSAISDSNSTTTTNFSSFTINEQQLNDSGMSIITMNPRALVDNETHEPDYMAGDASHLADDCITWNLNTKKLVKLPTLMHNTSSNLSSYHVCHPLELLGPASESIACRVSASIYSSDFSQNQLEAVVMLCKQFDFDRDPVKSTHLQAVYLSSIEDQRRISKSASAMMDHDSGCDQASGCGREATLLKSSDYELLASVTCFVSTLASCFVYSLHGKKVVCAQTITHPDFCLDLRPDLLNVYLLTPLGLQICSCGICDTTFRYDWSSSSDLNLSFIATDRMRVLTTKRFVILVACSVNGRCEVEFLEKPDLEALLDRIVDTVNHCNSISVRANLLTYLHASSHLALIASNSDRNIGQDRASIVSNLKSITIMLCKQLLQKRQTNVITNNRIDKAIKHLLDISMCDLSELMRRQMQSESAALADKQSPNCHKLELEIADSCNIESSTQRLTISDEPNDESKHNQHQHHRHHQQQHQQQESISTDKQEQRQQRQEEKFMSSDDDDEEDKPLDTDYELIRIYLKHSKYSQWLLDYLISISRDEILIRRVIDYIFEHNPRLLIKCAQRYPLSIGGSGGGAEHDRDHDDPNMTTSSSVPSTSSSASSLSDSLVGESCNSSAFCMSILVEKLEQLVEFDSTGINRATVLFTLATLYNALEDRQKCLAALAQIKPLNHLAITMCSNYELSRSIAGVVSENYPDVYALYLRQLSKRGDRFAKSATAVAVAAANRNHS